MNPACLPACCFPDVGRYVRAAAQDQSGRVTTAVLQVTMKTQGTTSTGTLPSTTPAPSRHHDSSTACPCLASWSRGQRRLSFTRLSYAAEVFSTDTFVGRVEARLGTRGGSVRYSWGEQGRGRRNTSGGSVLGRGSSLREEGASLSYTSCIA
ncbi:hypothetical protein E2C01_077951 [Portunus trituberculatus]|uniref:Uncharacterized protein n=1 Tax=Portunus trituberculatus TaxID=210409 RepID=A0A5B7INL6_PORTR|nr:hypothetical protein [Portunus trituberculatus]